MNPGIATFLKTAALVGTGAVLAVACSRVNVTFGPSRADAAPPTAPGAVTPALPPPSPSQIADARSVSRTFQQVAAQLSPSVVSIQSEKGGKKPTPTPGPGRRPRGGGGGGSPFPGLPFDFFGFGDGDEGPMRKQVSSGSGVVIDAKGYILTNNHVIDDMDSIKVRFADRREARATVIGTDPKTDLAVIKVENVKDLVPARLGDSERLQPGEWVIAIGNPFGFDHSVTVGVISAKGRSGLGSSPYEDYLQTDAAINPGNSGGPLVSLDGEVIGINTMIRGIGTMIGFAIPSNMAKPISDQLIKEGRIRRPMLGIVMQDVTPQLAAGLGAGAPDKGAIVNSVENDSPAARAGITPGDVITRVDGQPIDGSKAVQKVVLSRTIGAKVAVDVWRGGTAMQLTANLAERNEGGAVASVEKGEAGPAGEGKLGLALQTLTPELAQRLGIGEKGGAVISGVREDSVAAEAGVREGDVIVEVDRKRVNNADDAKRLLSAPRPGGHVVRLRRDDAAIYIVLPST